MVEIKANVENVRIIGGSGGAIERSTESLDQKSPKSQTI
jgi:hypothetical protein